MSWGASTRIRLKQIADIMNDKGNTVSKLHMIGGLACAMSLMIGGCATTTDSGTEMASASSSDAELICRRVHEVGSRLSSRACKTREEWDQEAAAAQEALERSGNSRSVQPFVNGPS